MHDKCPNLWQSIASFGTVSMTAGHDAAAADGRGNLVFVDWLGDTADELTTSLVRGGMSLRSSSGGHCQLMEERVQERCRKMLPSYSPRLP